MLALHRICYRYGSVEALKNISMEIPAGTVHGLVGMNGAGKTTLLQLIAGLLKVQTGSICYNEKIIAPSDVAFLPTHNYMYHYITGAEYLALFGAQNPQADFDSLNRIFKLPLKRLVDEYSTGMRKKLAFMGLMALKRPVFVLDEPFNGVDLEGTMAFQQAIGLLAEQGKTVVITSHILESLTEICHCIHYLHQGVLEGSYCRNAFSDLQNQLRARFAQDHQRYWEQFFS
ncbi:MAG: ATP-binding cassette domain-containing protein [Cytophagales bacterium]|nr:ATP-binding cassette domain-containing protein [Bernardetiaceae bacterium]MDW8203450.1 ATP-binding cassette domain-containing protein [Cytophagales bacterium]